MIPVSQAQELILEKAKALSISEISIHDATGYILAEDIYADRDYPPFNRAAMDGFALRSEDFIEKKIKEFNIIDTLFAGGSSTLTPATGECIRIMTGAATPLHYDCIIPVEQSQVNGNIVSFTTTEVKPGQNLAMKGEDLKSGEVILRRDTLLNAPQISALAVVGKDKFKVYTPPSIAIISTGDEVKPIHETLQPNEIRDSNSYALVSFLGKYKVHIHTRTIVEDNKEVLKKTIQDVLHCDIIIFSGGVSMGEADFVPDVLKEAGIGKVFHKIRIKPGKPLWFGTTPHQGVVFGLPGNPMSCQVCYKLFIEPYLRKCMGLTPIIKLRLPLLAGKKKGTPLDQFFPCRLEENGVRPVKVNGSGDITSTLYSEGMALHPGDSGELQAGDVVDFIFW